MKNDLQVFDIKTTLFFSISITFPQGLTVVSTGLAKPRWSYPTFWGSFNRVIQVSWGFK